MKCDCPKNLTCFSEICQNCANKIIYDEVKKWKEELQK